MDILQSGRWQNYLSDGELEDQLYELDLICGQLAEIAGTALA